MLTTSQPPVTRLSRKCDSLDVSQSYGPPRSVTGVALPFFALISRLLSNSFPPISYFFLERKNEMHKRTHNDLKERGKER
jgi:hypothetical protein